MLVAFIYRVLRCFFPVGELDGEDDRGNDGGSEAPGQQHHEDVAPAWPPHICHYMFILKIRILVKTSPLEAYHMCESDSMVFIDQR